MPGVLTLAFLPALLTLVIMGLLDTLGTLMGLGAAGGLLDDEGRFPEIQKPMAVDALTCGRGHEVKGGGWALGAICLCYYLFGAPH